MSHGHHLTEECFDTGCRSCRNPSLLSVAHFRSLTETRAPLATPEDALCSLQDQSHVIVTNKSK